MTQLILENSLLRLLLLVLLFVGVAAVGYFVAQAMTARQTTRRRLVEEGPRSGGSATMGSLRSEGVESNWIKLINAIEKSGVSLVDTKDQALRQRLIAAGFTAPYAPRLYTLLRLVLVIGLPVLVMVMFWVSDSSPSMVKLYLTLILAAALGLYV